MIVYMQTLQAAQFSEEDFFGAAIGKDLMTILGAIRETHVTDTTTADTTGSDMMKEAPEEANNYQGSAEEGQMILILKTLGIKYNKLTKEELTVLMNILRKSDLLKTHGSKRGKGGRKKK